MREICLLLCSTDYVTASSVPEFSFSCLFHLSFILHLAHLSFSSTFGHQFLLILYRPLWFLELKCIMDLTELTCFSTFVPSNRVDLRLLNVLTPSATAICLPPPVPTSYRVLQVTFVFMSRDISAV